MDTTIVILGASGDLTKKKLIPAIYRLIEKLDKFVVVGVARDDFDSKKLLNKSKKYIKNLNLKKWKQLEKSFYYFRSDFYKKKKFCELGPFIRQIEKNHKLSGNRLFYLATLPNHFEVISATLKDCGLAKGSKVVFEKPFGDDYSSARKINLCLKKVFDEKQIYRIDHFLGKEIVQNISIVRFSNLIFEPIWNKKYIDHVQIIMSENFGVEDRGEFYDKYGAIKDVVQNHMLQMMGLVAMEMPKKNIRDEKVRVLRRVKLTKEVVLGQYKDYKKIKGVKKGSKTETFAAMKLFIDNRRWKGVPFYLITGKMMKDKITSIYIQFKESKCLMFDCGLKPNYLVLQMRPDEGFYMQLNAKAPRGAIVPVKMEFCHVCKFGPNSPEAYENLILDVIKGNQSGFVRTDEIEEQWKIVDKIKKKKVYGYSKGSYPKEADKLTKWHLRGK